MSKTINIIDLFAGPGGLGEGFSSLKRLGKPAFKIRMSVEKEASAHQTLTLRALYRSLDTKGKSYYHGYVSGDISKSEMVANLSEEWAEANEETLGSATALGEDNEKIHRRLKQLRANRKGEPWIVIGGPPCQAYSLVGRARNKGIQGYKPENDKRHFLYQEYLEVLSIIQPDVFVMENVKGILTSVVGGERIFPKIRSDLEHPTAAIQGKSTKTGKRYRIYSLVAKPDNAGLFDEDYVSDSSFIIRAELFGIPQARHRVILLGVSEEISNHPICLKQSATVNIDNVLQGLPDLRSRLSKEEDSPEKWADAITKQARVIKKELNSRKKFHGLADAIIKATDNLKVNAPTVGRNYGAIKQSTVKAKEGIYAWLMNDRPTSVLNHESRGHISADLGRYLFSSCWAEVFKAAENPIPKAYDFPCALRPNHANWESGHFADRFRVQARGRPATTITSHISKDGHYYIHHDPTQCRSLTVREAARIQTFPDNYFFEGNRTQQYVQVGNAVPPFLAQKIAEVVCRLILNNDDS